MTISREGLRLFRCTSRSRPFRTWAIMSAEKILLYFAAENEAQAQEWMQAVRDGLWPPCFSFQMLSACTYDVSLIDDENSFLSGHLGVYGRFVLTSEDIISLMHPHWGAVLLQISLSNIEDVHLVRRADISSGGVFSIVLKSVKDSKVKVLYFYSITAMDVIQWILGKVLDKIVSLPEKSSELDLTKYNSKRMSQTERALFIDLENKIADYQFPNTSSCTDRNITGEQINVAGINKQYENSKCLKVGSIQNPNESSFVDIHSDNSMNSSIYGSVKKQMTSKEIPQQSLITLENESSGDMKAVSDCKKDLESKRSNLNFLEDKTGTSMTEAASKDTSSSLHFADTSTEYENLKTLNENFAQIRKNSLPDYTDASKRVNYAVVNRQILNSNKTQLLNEFSANMKISENNQSNFHVVDFNSQSLYANYNYEKTNYSSSNSKEEMDTSNLLDRNTDYAEMKSLNVNSVAKANISEIHSGDSLNSVVYSSINRRKDSSEQNMHILTNGISAGKSNIGSFRLLPNIPSDFLDASISSILSNNKRKESSSSDEDVGVSSPWEDDELNDLKYSDHVYEDLSERKGTVYEEIDDSNDEYVPPFPPQLPQRPKNLQIPDSLRLQKLSESVRETLKLMEIPTRTKEYTHPNLIKKIKEMYSASN